MTLPEQDLRVALRAVRLMILGSSDRANLLKDIDAIVAYGLGEQEIPTKLVGWLSVAAAREANPENKSYGDGG